MLRRKPSIELGFPLQHPDSEHLIVNAWWKWQCLQGPHYGGGCRTSLGQGHIVWWSLEGGQRSGVWARNEKLPHRIETGFAAEEKSIEKSARARERRGKMGRTDYFRWSLGQGRER